MKLQKESSAYFSAAELDEALRQMTPEGAKGLDNVPPRLLQGSRHCTRLDVEEKNDSEHAEV